ncbi:heavy metal translocatin [Amylocystis lapponica]|nr:heavy metal translocatin [Amylocystis lapponica]
MTDCCDNNKTSNPNSSGNHCETRHEHNNLAISLDPEVPTCCEDDNCKCDDDATHLHDQDAKTITPQLDSREESEGRTPCCAKSSAALDVNSILCHEKTHEYSAHHDSSASTDIDSCAHGLRKRATKHNGHKHEQPNFPPEACGEHKSIAHNRYKDTLAAFGCVCRAMLAHGLRSCCTTKHAHAANSRSASPRIHAHPSHSPSSVSTKNRHSIDSCCQGVSTSHKHSKPGSCLSINSCCGDGCCSDADKEGCDVDSRSVKVAALEKGVGAPNQHAILAIKGMTCTGCENQLIRALKANPAICNPKTSLVLCRAEFDFDASATDVQALIQTIEKRTGFSVEVVAAASTRELHLAVDRSRSLAFLAMVRPDGVDSVVSMDRDTFNVVYDPKVIGARKVLDYYAAFSPCLAPEPRDPALAANMKHIHTLAARTLLSAALTIPVLVMAWAPLPSNPRAYAIASLVLATLVQTVITGPVYVSALKSLLFSHLVETDLLVVLSTSAAYVYSVVAFAFAMHGRTLGTGEFFETSTLLVTLIILGQLVSAFARQRAMEAISIRSLQQHEATLVHKDGTEETADVRLLQYGDMFRVAPDSPIITDGTVRAGQSEVDESMMTGEASPVAKSVGSSVVAGTANQSGTLLVEVVRLPGENTISDIATMVDDARFSRARVQTTVDRVCAWFVPVVLVVSIVTFLVWLAVGIAGRGQSGGEAAVTALTYAIAVLAISCPCALGLAVPMVILIAGGVAARLGLVFKAATTIESARNITHVVFDKTGTLTQGELSVVSSDIFDVPGVYVREAILELVKTSRHPVARAVAAHLSSSDVDEKSGAQVQKIEVVTGKGIQGILADETLRGGSADWLEVADHPAVQLLLLKGLTIFCVTHKKTLVAVFGLGDALRAEASSVIDFSAGDIFVSPSSAGTIIPPDRVRAACLPADKQAYIKQLMDKGEKVLFCGDGTNDAVALAQADIGVHLHTGSDAGTGVAASTAADVVLIHPSLSGILALFALSEAVRRRIMLNFIWSAIYNTVAILFAAGAFVRARIAPAYAGLGEILRWFKWKM